MRRKYAPLFVLGGMLIVIFIVSQTCATAEQKVTQDGAVAIAREQIDYEPDGESVRFLRRGFDRHPYWAVSLWVLAPVGSEEKYSRVTTVVVDAENGDVTEVNRQVNLP
jgi:hypothetical protein